MSYRLTDSVVWYGILCRLTVYVLSKTFIEDFQFFVSYIVLIDRLIEIRHKYDDVYMCSMQLFSYQRILRYKPKTTLVNKKHFRPNSYC